MRKISIDIDCGEVTCGECAECVVFGDDYVGCNLLPDENGNNIWLEKDDRGNPLRCQQCLDAEIGGE